MKSPDRSTDQGDEDIKPSVKRVNISGRITGMDNTWKADTIYVLADRVTIANRARLIIEPGTVIEGARNSALIVSRGGELRAQGTALKPIVFTSAQPVGERLAGDWGGVAMLGNAPINKSDATLEGAFDDLPYGGDDVESRCGALEYVRIEFAGFELAVDKELNGLTLAGCGSDTLVRHVQIHRGKDDGLEIFGGTVHVKNILITFAQDDSLDIDQGWQGSAQFIAILQGEVDEGQYAIEASSSKIKGTTPRTAPNVSNLTAVALPGNTTTAFHFKEGVGGIYQNMLAYNYGAYAIDVVGSEAESLARPGNEGLVVKQSLFFAIGAASGSVWPPAEPLEGGSGDMGMGGDMGSGAPLPFSEALAFERQEWGNVFDRDPSLAMPFTVGGPDLTASSDAAISGASAPSGPGIEASAAYYGAFEPGVSLERSWVAGWTAFPLD